MERMEKKEQKWAVRNAKRLLLSMTLLCFLVAAAGCTAKESKDSKGSEEGASESASATDITGDTESPAAESPVTGEFASGLRLMPEEFPHVDGSALTIPFSETMAATVMNLPVEEARLYVLHSKAQDAYANLINGRADIIFATPPTEAELAYAKEQEVELKLTPILRSTLTFLVNAKNPVEDVSAEDLVNIYSGKVGNWKDLGGNDAEIFAYLRPENSSSQAGMLELVMKGTPIASASAEMICEESNDVVNAVTSFAHAEAAIGYSYYYYTMNAQSGDKIKYLKIDGVAPDEKSAADGSYPFVSTIYMALRQDEPADSAASKLAEWVLSEEGQNVAEKEGYIPMK
jgi:phosphate transport system substrate-binding protein